MAGIEADVLTPLAELLPSELLPIDLVVPESGSGLLDRIYLTDYVATQTQFGPVLSGVAAIEGELAVQLPGCPTLAVVLGAGVPDFTVAGFRLLLTPDWVLELDRLQLAFRVDPSVLHPADPTVPFTEIGLETGLRITPGGIQIEQRSGLALPKSFIGGSKVAIAAEGVRFHLRREPPDFDSPEPSFVGLSIAKALIELPPDAAALVPDQLVFENCLIGGGGFTGRVKVDWDTPRPTPFLFGFEVELQSLALRFEASRLVQGDIEAVLRRLPFFDTDVALDLGIGEDSLRVALSTVRARQTAPGAEVGEDGLLTLRKPGVLEMRVTTAALDIAEGEGAVLLSGTLKPLARFAGNELPGFKAEALTITSAGKVSVDGGWLDLPKSKRIGFGGFGLDLTRAGLGSEPDQARWVGFSGKLTLVEGVPLTATVDGLKILWDANGPRGIELGGIGLRLEVENVLKLDGEIRYDAQRERFDGSGMLQLIPLKLTVRAQIVIGKRADYSYLFLNLLLQPPVGVPLFSTGLSLYGFEALYARNMEPDKDPAERWFQDWYLRPEIGATDGRKWADERGSQAFGAGVMIGTTPDKGYSVLVKGLLVIVVPGPVVMLDARANLLKDPTALADPKAQALFNALAVFDGRQGTLELGIQPHYRYPDNGRLLDLTGVAEAFYPFDDPRGWHVYLGRHEPERRIRARLLGLFDADAYLMIEPDRIQHGGFIGYRLPKPVGPVNVNLEAFMECAVALSRRPKQLKGELHLQAAVGIDICGAGLTAMATATLAAQGPRPWEITGEVQVKFDVPWPIPDVDATVPLHWREPLPPRVAPVLEAVGVSEFAGSGASWPLAPGESGGPIVPLDGRIGLAFAQPVADLVGVDPATALPAPVEQVGDYRLQPALARLELEVFDPADPAQPWKGYASPSGGPRQLYGVWQRQPGDNTQGNRRLILWARTPYDWLRPLAEPNVLLQEARAGFDPCRPSLPARIVGFDDLPEQDLPALGQFAHAGWNWQLRVPDKLGSVMAVDRFARRPFLGTLPWPCHRALVLPNPWIFVPVPLDLSPQPGPAAAAAGPPPSEALVITLPEDANGITVLALSGAHRWSLAVADANGVQLRTIETDVPAGSGLRLSQLALAAAGIRRVVIGCAWDLAILAVVVRGAAPDTAERRAAVEQMLRRFSGQAPVLEPNRQYRLRVTTQQVKVDGPSLEGAEVEAEALPAAVTITGSSCSFEQTFPFRTEGPPGAAILSELQPGVRADHLATLETYMRTVVPARDAAAFYRNGDFGVIFNVDHVPDLYAGNQQVLQLVVRDDRGAAVAADQRIEQGDVIVRREDDFWFEQLERSSCALTVDKTHLSRETVLRATPRAGPLEPRRRYEVTLAADPSGKHEAERPLFRWSFTSSAYTGFADHFRLSGRPRRAAVVMPGGVWTELARPAFSLPDPFTVEGGARDAHLAAERTAFAALLSRVALDDALPAEVELNGLETADGATWAVLLASPEPLDWQRVRLALSAETGVIPFAPILRPIRDGSGARAILLALVDGNPVSFPTGSYRLTATYRRDMGPGAPVLSERGDRGDVVATIEWSVPVEPEPGVYPTGISRWNDWEDVRQRGTEILILKRRKGPLQIHIDSYPWGLTGGDIDATDAWVLSPSAQELWHGSRIDRILQPANRRTRPSGELATRLEVTVPTDESGLFRLLFGSNIFPLYQRLTDDLPEALLLKPAARFRVGSLRGVLVNPGPPTAPLDVLVSSVPAPNPHPGGPIRVNGHELQVQGPPISFTVETKLPLETVVGTKALGELSTNGYMLFGSDESQLDEFLSYAMKL